MSKYCDTYKITCTCVTCEGRECARSTKTRAEAEIIRSVRLNTDGSEVKDRVKTEEKVSSNRENTGDRPIPSPVWKEDKSEEVFKNSFRDNAIIISSLVLMLFAIVSVIYFLLPTPPQATNVAVVQKETEKVENEVETEQDRVVENLREEDEGPGEEEQVAESEVVFVPEEKEEDKSPISMPSPEKSPDEQRVVQSKNLKDQGNNAIMEGDIINARTFYEEALKVNPQFDEGFNNLANTYVDEGNYEQAEPLYLQAVRLDPEDTTIRYNLARNYLKSKRFEDALNQVDRVLLEDPQDAEAHLIAGVSKYYLERYLESIQHFDAMIKLNGEYSEAYYNLSLAYRQLGRSSLANTYYNEAVRINPKLRSSNYRQTIAAVP